MSLVAKFSVHWTKTYLHYSLKRSQDTGIQSFVLIYFLITQGHNLMILVFFLQVTCHKHSNNPPFKKCIYNIESNQVKYKHKVLLFFVAHLLVEGKEEVFLYSHWRKIWMLTLGFCALILTRVLRSWVTQNILECSELLVPGLIRFRGGWLSVLF